LRACRAWYRGLGSFEKRTEHIKATQLVLPIILLLLLLLHASLALRQLRPSQM
jgi:hypothetical protein